MIRPLLNALPTRLSASSHAALLVLLPLMAGLLVAGCDSTSSTEPTEPTEPETNLDETLEAGGAAKTGDGVYLVAAAESIDEPVSIATREVSDPEGAALLPEGTDPKTFYRVSGSRSVDLSTQSPPLYTALPVPDAFDPANVALAVRIPRDYTTDGTSDAPYGWDVLRGAYEPERGVLVVPTRFLVADGIVFGIVETPTYDAPSMDGTAGETLFDRVEAFFSAKRTAVKASKSDFKVQCKGFGGSGCGSDEKDDVKSYLSTVSDDYVSGFREPDLRTPLFSKKSIWVVKKKGTAWCKGNTAGKYLSLTNKAITCFDPDNQSDPPKSTTRHEFFHAIQYNYAPISWSKLPKQRPNWVLEATAELAEDTRSSATNVVRAGTDLRPIDTPLTADSGKPDYPEYRAQDFWVHLISSRSSTPAQILDPVFDQQSNGTNKPTAKKVDELYSLDDAYWDWIRNQAFDAEVTAGYDGKLNGACIFDSRAASPTTVSYDAGSRTSAKSVSPTVSKLTGKVMAVEVTTGANRIDLEITASTSDAKSYVEIYPDVSSSTTDCWSTTARSSDTLTDVMLESKSRTVYVLLGATMIDDAESDFTLTISHDDRPTK
jgi:hypothetical protein